MGERVNRSSALREARKADTEQRIIDAATRLFLTDGYAKTTLTAVAAAAEVGDRTVYSRFGNKAELLKRVVDVAVVGDTAEVPLAARDWPHAVETAPTLHDRALAYAEGTATMMQRLGPLISVAAQAEPTEPLIAAAAQAGREHTRAHIDGMWRRLHADGLMNAAADLEWAITTAGLLGSADTYVLISRTLAWSREQYRDWLYRSWIQLATSPAPDADTVNRP